MPRASAADAAKTATRIADDATRLFQARGFSRVTLDDVAAAADVTRGAVYHHYGSKKGVFLAVAARLQAQVANAVTNAAEQPGLDANAALRAGSHAFLEAISTGPAARVLLIEAPAVLDWQEWRRLDAENSAAHLREGLRATGVAESLLDAMTAHLSGAMNEAALWAAQAPDPAAALALAHEALDVLLDAVADDTTGENGR
ncbi:TetR family transcriptional regulator [Pseudoclavibacter endophyticus]|uniref:TetR/AcrR family transcriptional regulator n=1 Tax=Pseudoclavibacter endophyticus TaxID=1778590 RepID=A0A6H9WP43_9MICO|nr:TetR/AcrR family transcriptional regulator [Pseudoclavibacter endophyticus]KAB1649491.1 TetR/AcrR family transcriptional regulator [Pseudoclavibacter endophyticus]GGA62220.1 TetR family transcriptional regulator [Pseudoclavibacter endophyticus]